MDRNLFRAVNRFADRTGWLHPIATAYAKYGVVLFVLLLAWAWLDARRSNDIQGQAQVGWVGAAAGIALGIGQVVGAVIDRARPYETMHDVTLLVSRTTDFSMPSDHATAAGAAAVGLVFVNRRLGILASVMAIVMAATRVYVGAHYPADVAAGLVLGGSVAALGATYGRNLVRVLLVALTRLPGGHAVFGRPIAEPTSA